MRLSRRKWSMARKHTIFIGALFHVAIAMFKSDSPMLDNVVPASYLELLSSTSQLPPAAARTWQWTLRDWGGLGFKRLAIDFSIHTSKSSSHVFHGKNPLQPPPPQLKLKVSDWIYIFISLQGRIPQGSPKSNFSLDYKTAAALPRSSFKKHSYSRTENTLTLDILVCKLKPLGQPELIFFRLNLGWLLASSL